MELTQNYHMIDYFCEFEKYSELRGLIPVGSKKVQQKLAQFFSHLIANY